MQYLIISPRQCLQPLIAILWVCFLTLAGAPQAQAQPVVFPADAGVIDVTLPPYSANPDDSQDDTGAIQAALNDYPSGNRIIYFPKGTYLLTRPLTFPAPFKRTILQGESETHSILRLQDHCPGFSNPDSPQYLLRTARIGFSADAFRNGIRNLTFDTGKGNPGAIAVQFFGSNQCRIEQVTLRSGDGKGAIGLDLGYTPDNGPGLIRNLTVKGFDTGVALDHKVNSFTFEYLTLRNQQVQGLRNARQVCTIRHLRSNNKVPALVNVQDGVLTVTKAHFLGGNPAQNPVMNEGNIYLDQVRMRGNASSSGLAEENGVAWHLPVAETPAVRWDRPADWGNPEYFGANGTDTLDDTRAIQQTIDAGWSTVYFPAGKTFRINDTLYLRGNMRRMIGCEGRIGGKGAIVFENGNAPAVVIERLFFEWGSKITLWHRADRTLIGSSITGPEHILSTGKGDFFLDDVVVSTLVFQQPGQRIFARQLDTEDRLTTNILNNGAHLWILGYKTERAATKIETRNHGITEVIGAHIYGNLKPGRTPPDDPEKPVFRVENGYLSVTQARYFTSTGLSHHYGVLHTRGQVVDTVSIGSLPPDGVHTFSWQSDIPPIWNKNKLLRPFIGKKYVTSRPVKP